MDTSIIEFTKMQGAGNDYVYIDCLQKELANVSEIARWVSDRHFGIGSDGLVLILPSEKADFRMRMFNADGSEAEMCGNATRCVGKYVYDHRLTQNKEISLETKAGIKYLHLYVDADNLVEKVSVDMGCPILDAASIPVISALCPVVDDQIDIDGDLYRMTCVSMGNPHAIVFVDDVKKIDIETIGPKFENHIRFPRRTNTEFVEIVSPECVRMRVWERGAGETLACGTGACATLVACVLNHKTLRKAVVELVGGELTIEWTADNHIIMTGPAKTVFKGQFEWPE